MTFSFKASFFGLAMLSVSSFSFASSQAISALQQRLELASQYSADFEQTVRSAKGKELQKGSGRFYVKRPNLFRLESQKPQENLIVSDGDTLWFYDPFVSQVTANRVSDAVANTPFILLTSNDKQHWDQYDVTQDMDNFVLKPKSKKNAIKQFDIRIDANGLLKGFSTIERDGQSNLYMLRRVSSANVSADLFKFTPPKGVEIDDQRKTKSAK